MKDLHDKNKKHYTDFEREKQTKFGYKSKIVGKRDKQPEYGEA